MTPAPAEVWVFYGVDGSPCLVRTDPPTSKDDFDHPFERASRYRLIPETETRARALPNESNAEETKG